MRKSIDIYIESIASDNADFINSNVADYIIESAEASGGWAEFFDDEELDGNQGEPTDEQIAGLKDYLRENWGE